MRKKDLLVLVTALELLGIIGCAAPVRTETQKDYPIRPVLFTDVRIEDEFWAPRLETNRKVSIPYAFKQVEEMGVVDNFAIAGGRVKQKGKT